MSEWIIPVVVGVLAASGAWVSARMSGKGMKYTRLRDLETRIDLVEKRNVLLWNYNRLLVDHIYENKPPPPPEMPDGLV